MDREYKRPDEHKMAELEARAVASPPSIPNQCLPTAEYLEKFVLPSILPALEATSKNRPKNPIEFFSYYLLAQRNK